MTRLVAGILVLVLLTGCGRLANSKLNPFNWFGRSKPEITATVDTGPRQDPALTDPRPLIGTVERLSVERAAGGAIITAVGLAPSAGYWGAELVPLADETAVNGALVYFFRVEAPARPTAPGGPAQTRRISVARFVADDKLAGVRSIVVRGAANQRRSAR